MLFLSALINNTSGYLQSEEWRKLFTDKLSNIVSKLSKWSLIIKKTIETKMVPSLLPRHILKRTNILSYKIKMIHFCFQVNIFNDGFTVQYIHIHAAITLSVDNSYTTFFFTLKMAMWQGLINPLLYNLIISNFLITVPPRYKQYTLSFQQTYI